MEVRNSNERLQLTVFEAQNKVNICVQNLQKVTDKTIADISCLLETFTEVSNIYIMEMQHVDMNQ